MEQLTQILQDATAAIGQEYFLLPIHGADPVYRERVYCYEISYGKKTHLRFQGMGVPPTEGSCRVPLIVLQQTTQSFLATLNSLIPARPSIRQWEQEPVLLALVIPLLVITCHVLLQQFV